MADKNVRALANNAEEPTLFIARVAEAALASLGLICNGCTPQRMNADSTK
jgi:hypothetical protein